jgi:tRNA G10  N-methylase Trm11
MKLTEEFEATKTKVLRQEELMEMMLDETLNKKRQHLNDISDYYFEQHMQEIACLYQSISDRIDYLYTLPITRVSKSNLKMHVDDVKKIQPALVDRIKVMQDDADKKRLDPEHQITISKVIIGFSKMADNHQKLIKDFVNMVSAQKGGNTQSPPSQP